MEEMDRGRDVIDKILSNITIPALPEVPGYKWMPNVVMQDGSDPLNNFSDEVIIKIRWELSKVYHFVD